MFAFVPPSSDPIARPVRPPSVHRPSSTISLPPSAVGRPPSAIRRLPSAVCLLLLAIAGCDATLDDRPAPQPHPLAGITLELTVVGDPALAAAIGQLRGEWKLQTGADFQVRPVSESKLIEDLSRLPGNPPRSVEFTEKGFKPFLADAVIGPAYFVGAAADQERIIPLTETQLRNASGNWSDIFDLLRLHEASWGTKTWAIPFGSPVLVCYCRADLLEKLGRDPPRTWDEYLELARLLADRTMLGPKAATKEKNAWWGTVEPLDSGWAGLVLLAHAAPYAKHRDNYSTLFRIDTMAPLIAGPPFVKALEDLVAAAKLGPPDALDFDPDAARNAFWQGHCGMALSWPTAAAATAAGASARGLRVVFSELPYAGKAFNVGNQQWEGLAEDQDPHVPLLGLAGRVGAVCSAAKHRDAALELLAWLSSNSSGDPASAASPATTLYRRSQLKSAINWVEKPVSPAAASQYAAITETTFRRSQWLEAPRIPGRDEYLAALDRAVRQAVQSKQSPAAALQQAAAQWREITDRLGRERQRGAYLRSLNLEP